MNAPTVLPLLLLGTVLALMVYGWMVVWLT